jgi:hypothetical protein
VNVGREVNSSALSAFHTTNLTLRR